MKIALVQNVKTVPTIFSKKALDLLEQLGEVVINDGDSTAEQVKKTVSGADIAVTSWGNSHFTDEILDRAPGLKLIAHAAGSVKPIVADAVWERGIRVTGSPKPIGCGVAETALGFTISASKNFYNLNAFLHGAGNWRNDYEHGRIVELCDITVGVIGAGWAGGHYVSLLKNFDVNILLYDPFVDDEKISAMGAEPADLATVLKNADIVSLHAPSIPETRHMIDARTLGLMKKDAVLINTARGSLIDEDALYAHMKAGGLKYACMDVYDPEPPEADSPLRLLPNVIMTPHLAGAANNGRLKIGMHIVSELKLFLSGERMECEVTKDMLAKMA